MQPTNYAGSDLTETLTVIFTNHEFQEKQTNFSNLSHLRKILFIYWLLLKGLYLEYSSHTIYFAGKYTATFPKSDVIRHDPQ